MIDVLRQVPVGADGIARAEVEVNGTVTESPIDVVHIEDKNFFRRVSITLSCLGHVFCFKCRI